MASIQSSNITRCRSCKSGKLEELASFGNQYLSEFRGDDKKPYRSPIELVFCNNCNLLQLKQSTNPELLYTDNYGYYSGINNTIKENLKHIVESAQTKIALAANDIVVDIGSNDATLLKYYPETVIGVGFDPVSKFKEFYEANNLYFINNYFNKKDYVKLTNRKAKIVTAISCFYDLEDPNTFLEEVRGILHPNGMFVIQQNYAGVMVENLAFDNVVHEHVEYYSLKSLEHLLARNYLKIVDVELNTINGGSLLTYIRHMTTYERIKQWENEKKVNSKWTYILFALKTQETAKKLKKFIEEEKAKGKTIYAYGASTRGNSLLQVCKLDNKQITAAVERNPVKYGKKIAGLGIPIISEEQARKEKPDYFLVLPYFFKDEFVKREQEYLKSGGALIFPLPKFEVVRYENNGSNANNTK